MLSARVQAFSPSVARALGKPGNLFAVFIGLSVVLRMATFGHPNIDNDEPFYFLVGQAMHGGAIPYVDIWDRKPVGLFAIYYVFARMSDSIVPVQVAAAVCAGATAATIALIGQRLRGRQGGVLAGVAYLVMLPILWGFSAQAPVFYNLLIALAALLVLTSLDSLRLGVVPARVFLAMALCGMAITVKQTAVFESIYFGLFVAFLLIRSSSRAEVKVGALLLCAAIGAAPAVLSSAWFWMEGYWAQYWQAMALSNVDKAKPELVTMFARSLTIYLSAAPIMVTALLGYILWRTEDNNASEKCFVGLWIVSGVIGLVAVPNFYPHYMLPLLVPLCVCLALFFGRKDLGLLAFAIVAGLALWRFDPFGFRYTRMAQASVGSMAQSIRQHDRGRGLLVYDGPVLLYSLTGNAPLSPLALPLHLNYEVERDVSHLKTNDEVARILSRQPGAVTMPVRVRNNPPNRTTWQMVSDYVRRNCRLVDMQMSREWFRSDLIAVYADCNPDHPPLRPAPVPPPP